jgi:peptidoglycan/LPS O-acetylase OafA/YrhL
VKSKTIYFPGLNGLRAIAAIAVVVSHITLALKEFDLDPAIFGSFKDGKPIGLLLAAYGVTIFFVLSGFLITYLLQADKEQNDIDIKKFYVRRILRIWPLYYLYFAIALIVIWLTGAKTDLHAWPFYIFFAANVPFILGNIIGPVAHYWSLGVEEQFYLFWPWVNKKIHDNKIIPILCVSIGAMVGAKLALHVLHPDSKLEMAIHVTRFHCMMVGALGAILYKRDNQLFFKIVDNRVVQTGAWIAVLLMIINKFHIASIIDNEIVSIIALVLIIGQIRIKNRIVNLEKSVFDFLGKISYGIYVIHPLLILFMSKIFLMINIPVPYKYFVVYTAVLAVTILFSYLSYTYFEKYFLTLKTKFIVVKSSATNTETD